MSRPDPTPNIKNDQPQTDWKVKARAGRKVEAIKSLRELTGSGLKEAKDAVEEYCAYSQRYDAPFINGVTTTTTKIRMGDGSTLEVVSNGAWASIVRTQNVAVNVPADKLLQTIADLGADFR